MHEEPPAPFDTIGDAPVEARIVAWVLGEASAFEAAELERLCEERPELLVFRRRMRALHGLLTEAEAAEPDHSWKLPPEKRKVLDEIFGEEKVGLSDPEKELRIRRSRRQAILAIAACLVLTVIVAGLFASGGASIQKARKTSHTLEPERRVDFMPSSGGGGQDVAGALIPRRSAEAMNWQELQKAVRDQEAKVEERRKGLDPLASINGDFFAGKLGMSQDQGAKKQIEETNASEVSDESLARKDDASSRHWSSTPSQPAAGFDLAKGSSTADSPASPLARAAGMAESSRHRQPAKPRMVPPAGEKRGSTTMSESESMSVVESPPATAASGLSSGGAGGGAAADNYAFKTPTPQLQPQVPATRGASPAPAQISDFGAFADSSDATGKGSKGRDSANGRDETDADVTAPADPVVSSESAEAVAGEGPTLGLRSGDQAINRNNIDAILNNPSRSKMESASKAKERRAESDAKPPVLADNDPGIYRDQPADTAAADNIPGALGQVSLELAEDGKKLGEGFDSRNYQMNLPYAGRVLEPEEARRLSKAPAEPSQAVDQVRRSLYTAEGNYNLGKYEDAKKSYQDTLKIDPYNSAARQGLERVEVAKSDYYRAAYDHTRAELLSQVDSDWALAVPADGPATPGEAKPLEDQGAAADPFAEPAAKTAIFGRQLELQVKQKSLFTAEYEPPPVEPTLVELMEEIPASENPYSTFSLNISDASFQVAKAALAKGERPDPASIKPEQFYNAVDYGDPAPASNEPVAATIEQSAHPIIPGRNLVRVALRTGSVGRSAAQPLRLTLLVDQSGSMVRADRRAAMEHALAQLGGLLTKADLVTVIGFSRTPHLLAVGMTGDQAGKLCELVNQTASEGGTNLEEAMKLGAKKAAEYQLAGAQNRIVLFTDGAANLGDAKPERLAELVKSFRQQGLAFDIAGIGADGLNDRLLSELARNGNGRYYVVGNEKNDSFARQLAGAFRPAAENVKVQVNFNPQRVGKYRLIGFEKDRLKTEDFRNDAVDAAELAAEEAGVAIYQVEPLAEGTGEIGEVSVRFRDTASQEMVERTWTIPYASQATAFDRATPSMQLAGLSLLAAEKLKGGPLADAIDFKQLTGPGAFVKQFYGGSIRVADMLQVIEALK